MGRGRCPKYQTTGLDLDIYGITAIPSNSQHGIQLYIFEQRRLVDSGTFQQATITAMDETKDLPSTYFHDIDEHSRYPAYSLFLLQDRSPAFAFWRNDQKLLSI